MEGRICGQSCVEKRARFSKVRGDAVEREDERTGEETKHLFADKREKKRKLAEGSESAPDSL